jgi:hypothetical protein
VIRLPLKTTRNECILFVRDLAVETAKVAEGCAAASVGGGSWGHRGSFRGEGKRLTRSARRKKKRKATKDIFI